MGRETSEYLTTNPKMEVPDNFLCVLSPFESNENDPSISFPGLFKKPKPERVSN